MDSESAMLAPKVLEEGKQFHQEKDHDCVEVVPAIASGGHQVLSYAPYKLSWFWRNILSINFLLALWGLSFLGKHIVNDFSNLLRGNGCNSVTKPSRNPAYLIRANHGAVATENERCSLIGVQVLKDGGNAVDAAISASLCTGVVNMFSSGIGGGGFMVVRIPPSTQNNESEIYSIDFREVAPALANETMFRDDPISAMYGGLSVAVPTELRGFEEAHRRWGKLSWKRIVQPSADLASGWTVDRELGHRMPWYGDLMLNDPDWKDIFAPEGSLLREGDVIRRTNYSRTLATIAAEGAQAFYRGPIADSIIRKVQSTSGVLTHEDLANVNVKVQHALEGTYRGRKIYTTHAPSSGPALLHMLNLMERFDLVGEGRTPVNAHRSVEAMKFGFAARTKLCDPEFDKNSTRIDEISTKEYADLISVNLTDDRTHPSEYYNPAYEVETDHGTSHTSTVDKDGMSVSLTSSINLLFGSQLLDPETGIILNDEMDDFATPGVPNAFGLLPSPYNYPAPGKRPLSSIAPAIIEHADGSLYACTGGSGGSRIFGSIFQVILNLDWGLDVSQAIEYGRLHDQLYPMEVEADDVYPSEILASLRGFGHNITVLDINRVAAVVQAIVLNHGKIFAASDSRKNGVASGY